MGFNLQQQVEKHGLYENASECVRALIRIKYQVIKA